MALKDSLLRKGYLPEDLPPPFTSTAIADYFLTNPPRNYLMRSNRRLRAATYNASKRGMARRMFSAIHPVTAYDMAHFLTQHWRHFSDYFEQINVSFSIPSQPDNADRALTINSHSALEKEKSDRLSSYRFVATTDIARFYHSIYTHSIPWAYHGKAAAKSDTSVDSRQIFLNRADAILRNGQDGQTIGIPVGPDMSRALAELIATAIDLAFVDRLDGIDCTVLRHVDDVWIGTHTHADAERALSRYREAIREFELDINENKTGIFAEDFSFAHSWPSEISTQIEFAINTPGTRGKDHLRSALENSFAMAVERNDDGILKYTLRYIDSNELSDEHWDVVEPYLKRLSVHFGHTIDYVARILVWRHLSRGDLDVESWSTILGTTLDNHGRLGNDSEVCWIIYTHQILGIEINREVAGRIIRNCGALTLVALLHSVNRRHLNQAVLEDVLERLENEEDTGRYWPVFLEWKSRQWPHHERVVLTTDIIQDLSRDEVCIYDQTILPPVFRNVAQGAFGTVAFAIEHRSSIYEDENVDEDLGADEDLRVI